MTGTADRMRSESISAASSPRRSWISGPTEMASLDFSRPGKPKDNAYAQSHNAIVRTECLGLHWFLSLDGAREKVEAWLTKYNEVRPHGAIGDRPPIAMLPWLKTASRADQPPEVLT